MSFGVTGFHCIDLRPASSARSPDTSSRPPRAVPPELVSDIRSFLAQAEAPPLGILGREFRAARDAAQCISESTRPTWAQIARLRTALIAFRAGVDNLGPLMRAQANPEHLRALDAAIRRLTAAMREAGVL